jgi:hypothetical protein
MPGGLLPLVPASGCDDPICSLFVERLNTRAPHGVAASSTGGHAKVIPPQVHDLRGWPAVPVPARHRRRPSHGWRDHVCVFLAAQGTAYPVEVWRIPDPLTDVPVPPETLLAPWSSCRQEDVCHNPGVLGMLEP